MASHYRIFSALRSGLCSLLLCGAGFVMFAPAIAACGSAQKTTTGEAPESNADMKEVVINVFGMT